MRVCRTSRPSLSCVAIAWCLIGLDQQPPGSWRTYTHTKWELVLDYPASWSVDDTGEVVTFRSPDGGSVELALAARESRADPAPGRRGAPPSACTTTTTPHDVVATTCVDPTSHAARTVLVLEAHTNHERRVMLRSRGAEARVFEAMVASVRPVTAAPAARSLVRASPRITRATLRRS